MKYFDLSLPENQFQDYQNLGSMIIDKCIKYKTTNAVIDRGIYYTYNDLYLYINNIVQYFNYKSIQKKQMIGVFASDGIDYIVASLASIVYDNIFIALPYELTSTELLYYIQKYHLQNILYDYTQVTKINELTEKYQQYTNTQFHNITDIKFNSYDLNLSKPNESISNHNDIAIIMFTTGSEGEPKGVQLTHHNIFYGIYNGFLGFGVEGYKEENQLYQLTIPLYHIFGFLRNLLSSIYTGSTLIISQSLKDIFSDMQKYNPTRLITVPGICEIMIKLMKLYGKEFIGTKLEYIIIGGADLPKTLIQDIVAFNIPLYGGYGMTETAHLFIGNPYIAEYPDSIGYLYPYEEIKIIDGELWIKGDNVFVGYYGEDISTTFDNEGYFPTGDLIDLDPSTGLMYFKGRKKDIIVLSSGVNIAPKQIEDQIYDLIPEIKECQVYSLDNSNLICEIYANSNIDNKVLQKINQNLPPHQKIQQFLFREIPFDKTKKLTIQRKR